MLLLFALNFNLLTNTIFILNHIVFNIHSVTYLPEFDRKKRERILKEESSSMALS